MKVLPTQSLSTLWGFTSAAWVAVPGDLGASEVGLGEPIPEKEIS